MRWLVAIGLAAIVGCATPPPAPDGWRVMPEGASVPGSCVGFAAVDHQGELRLAATLGELVGTEELLGGSPRPQGEGWLVVVPGSRNPGRIYESDARGQALERTGPTTAVAAIVEGDGLLLADNQCQLRPLQIESSIIRVGPTGAAERVAGPWPICIRAMARDADAQIWLLASVHPHYEVEIHNVLFRLDASGSVLHHEYTLNPQPDIQVVGTGGLTHMEIVDDMIWLSGVATPVVRLRRDGEGWIEERVVPRDCGRAR